MNSAATVAVTALLVAVLAALLYCLRTVVSSRLGLKHMYSYAPLLSDKFCNRCSVRKDADQWSSGPGRPDSSVSNCKSTRRVT
ncbi:unnamed protein product [Soboliphyme baturini]|uniref:Secreted protein n=1 Tax=Soboliphyme baturini TaxID=241478 RepID=A0A183IS07_9BILA|nr:unnamed protein product [Soboliphyme baturini]